MKTFYKEVRKYSLSKIICLDVNGATNIYRIAKNAINGIERPKYLCREKKDENIKVGKPKKVVQKKANKSVKVVALTKT